MWALRRASIQLRNRGLSSVSARILDVNYGIGGCSPENYDHTTIQPQGKRFCGELCLTRSYNAPSNSSKLHLGICAFSSRAGAKNTTGEDDELEDAFSELEAPCENNDDSIAQPDLSESEDVAEYLGGVFIMDLLAAPQYLISEVMDNWVEEGNRVTAEEAMLSMSYLLKRRLFAKALQLSEWLEATDTLLFREYRKKYYIDSYPYPLSRISTTEDVEPNLDLKATLARQVAASGQKDKAEALLKEIEQGTVLEKNHWACRTLLHLYASLGKEEEVARIWEMCESEARFLECLVATEAWGQLGKIENAESAFEKIAQKVNNPSTEHYMAMLYVYASHKMLTRGKDLVRGMMGPREWDAAVRLYVASGEVGKASDVLKEALERKDKTMFLSKTYDTVLDEFAKRGDVRSAEDMFDNMRRAGCVTSFGPYRSLRRAYLYAKDPAYGFRERMKDGNCYAYEVYFLDLMRFDSG